MFFKLFIESDKICYWFVDGIVKDIRVKIFVRFRNFDFVIVDIFEIISEIGGFGVKLVIVYI